MAIGNCKFVNPDISHIYLAEWQETIIPIYSSNNVIERYEWVDEWFEIKLNTARATFGQEMSTKNSQGIYFNTTISINIPKAENQKWKDLVDFLNCNKYIIVFRDGNGTYFTSGYKWGMQVRNYQLSENQYIISFQELSNNLPTLIDETYVLNNIILTPTPSPSVTPTPSATPSRSITPSATVTPSISTSITPSITITPSISLSPTISNSITPSISISPSITPSITPSTSSTIGTLALENNASIPSISDVKVQDITITTASFPLVYPDTTTGYTSDTLSQNVDVYITDWEGGSNYITLIDSNSVTYYKTVEGNSGHTFASVYISVGIPVRISLEDGSAPSPSVTPSISTSITPTPSTSTGSSPTPSPTLTPSVTPSPFGPTINISNDGTYYITDVQISGITISDITFPITPSNSAVGHTTIYNNNVSIDVTLSQGSTGESITVNLNCTTTDGGNSYNFSGVDTTTGTVTISYSTGICS